MKVKQIIIAVLTVLGMVASAWGVTKIFVLKPVYDMEIAGISEQIIQMQKNNKLQRARDEVFFWQREEIRLTEECRQAGQQSEKCRQLDEARRFKYDAMKRLKELE